MSVSEKKLISISEFCRMAGIGLTRGCAAAKEGALPVPIVRVGKRLMIPRAAAERMLQGDSHAR
jgi:hypothetical protein